MKIICKCFGTYTGVNIRSSPFIKDDNIVDVLPNHSEVEIEHCIYNDGWFKLKNETAYIISWLRTTDGLIDYILDRGYLKTFSSKYIEEDITTPLSKLSINETFEISQPIPPPYSEPEVVVKQPIVKKKPTRTKKERIPATVRNIVWVTHFQTSKKGQCWLCKVEDISSANFECGHVVSEKNGGLPTIDNLRPICSFCNKSVGTMNMEDFKRKYNIP